MMGEERRAAGREGVRLLTAIKQQLHLTGSPASVSPPPPRDPLTGVDMDAHNDTKGKVFVSLCGKVTHNLRHSAILSGPAIDLCCQGCLGPSGNINILSRKIGKKLNWKMGRNLCKVKGK